MYGDETKKNKIKHFIFFRILFTKLVKPFKNKQINNSNSPFSKGKDAFFKATECPLFLW